MIMTGFGTIETAVEAIKRGAEDYLTKPLEPDAVKKKVGRILEVFRLRGRVSQLESNLHRYCPSFDSLVYVSPVMQRARREGANRSRSLIRRSSYWERPAPGKNCWRAPFMPPVAARRTSSFR